MLVCSAIASVAETMKRMSGSLVLFNGVGTHTITASALAKIERSVVASSRPLLTCGAMSLVATSAMYDSPLFSRRTFSGSLSSPVTR